MKQILIGIDRDGVINKDPGWYGKDENWQEQFEFFPGVIEGLRLLRNKAYVIVASNQAGVARGLISFGRMNEVTDFVREKLGEERVFLHGWYSCPYVDLEYAKKHNISSKWVCETDLRKPGIGMIKKACNDLGLKLQETQVYFIGDRKSDVETGLNANGKGILVLTGEGEKNYEDVKRLREQNPGRVYIARNFEEATKFVLGDITI